MEKPSKLYSPSPRSTGQFMPEHIPDPSLRGAAFDQLLQNRGIRFLHRISAPCPNVVSLNANNHISVCTFCDNSQILYLEPREIWGVFTSNALEKMFEVQGIWEIGTAVITFPTEYPSGDQANFNIYDRLVCPDFQIRTNDLKEYEPTFDGRQYLRYNIVNIEHMVSVRNGVLYVYTPGVDFDIVEGGIAWIKTKEPRYNTTERIGEVLSITYTANPIYTVMNTMHELRVTQEYDVATGNKIAKRLPQQILVKRDFLTKGADKESL